MQLTQRDYRRYLPLVDPHRVPLHKTRRCFNFGNQVNCFFIDYKANNKERTLFF